MGKIIDCVLYNGEREIFSLRLNLMAKYVDKFVVLEANQTFTGINKISYFEQDKEYFKEFLNKIDYYFIQLPSLESSWEREFFLRNLLKTYSQANDDDIIIIADVDEILNLENIFKKAAIDKPYRIELSTYYYFFNVISTEKIYVTLISPFLNIKDINIGNRNVYKDIFPNVIYDRNGDNGGHFTYMFGWDINKYISKIESFSHTELDNDYYKNPKRIFKCLIYNFDLFDRHVFRYKTINIKKIYPHLWHLANTLPNMTSKFRTINKSILLSCFTRWFDKYYWRVTYWHFRYDLSKLKKKFFRWLQI